MTKREQWKALRAPTIRNALALKPSVHFWADLGANDAGNAYPEARAYARAADKLHPDQKESYIFRFGTALNALSEMRAAERSGMDPLIWKLTHG